jgi:hypothetical protein
MSTMIDPGDPLPEPDAQEVARRLRMYMGDKKLSRSQLALSSGITRTSLGAKLDGHVPFTIEEIVSVARAISRSWVWVLTGVDDPDSKSGRTGDSFQPTGWKAVA